MSASSESAALSPAAVFGALSAEFDFDRGIGLYLVEEWGLKTLSDFQHAFTGEWEISALVEEVEPAPPKADLRTPGTFALFPLCARSRSIK